MHISGYLGLPGIVLKIHWCMLLAKYEMVWFGTYIGTPMSACV